MIEERVFDFVAVRSEESREIGEGSDGIVDVAGFEKGEHCCIRGGGCSRVAVLVVLDRCHPWCR